ncbi:MAG: Peptidase M15B and M15C DD-carboxypeptidase VanY/endolysin [candidate division WS6 bacterium GW2011_GWE1_34_7]|uniref:Peptidase M15B and M15C DD-carboxypeptidase VanY/endolysin n=1 Tax=candidate division WS6 bacterium GW2011_GWE1_34_7 TaxID=1619093 RepID=A0A0G0DQY0_9BACT|nr:MAG: Peptidase M15B and M15C DD-carboxypeptidase VanY/endolysin [candidate division WS6 bacterium GW2011_GWE1_34_7]
MKKSLIYILLLILMFFLPAKTADMIINTKDEDKEERGEWVIKEPEDTSVIEKIEDEVIEEEKEVDEKDPDTTKNWWEYPDEIFPTKRSGDDLLVLVNKQYKLSSTYAPKDLVKASISGIRRGENYYLRNILINNLKRMVTDIKSAGIDISIVSAYRSYQTQVNTYNYWLSKNDNDVAYVDTFSARPGHSQHQLGTVIDFSSSEIGDRLGDEFANTKASKWLIENSYKYGFVISFPKGYETVTGYKFESWHYRYIGVEYAQEMINKGEILELYLRGYNP